MNEQRCFQTWVALYLGSAGITIAKMNVRQRRMVVMPLIDYPPPPTDTDTMHVRTPHPHDKNDRQTHQERRRHTGTHNA